MKHHARREDKIGGYARGIRTKEITFVYIFLPRFYRDTIFRTPASQIPQTRKILDEAFSCAIPFHGIQRDLDDTESME